jgi:8-oxo-dGTP pyrophosphatase MutT (NUDIX family)
VIVVRNGPAGGIETFMLVRPEASRFAAGATVFPGGAVSPADASDICHAVCRGLGDAAAMRSMTERGGEAPADPSLAFAFHTAALRELFEESGVMVGRGVEPAGIDRLRDDARVAGADFWSMARDRGLVAEPERLVYFSHWVTPATSPIRFDTRFFVVEMPAGQVASHCQHETTHGEWMRPHDVLARFEIGAVKLVDVTVAHLRRLSTYPTVSAVMSHGRTKAIESVNPPADRTGPSWREFVESDRW